MVDRYGKSLWIDFCVLSLVLALVLQSEGTSSSAANKQPFLLLFLLFVACIVFSLALPKFGITGDMFTVWIPAVLGLISIISVAVAGAR
jgi:hypothetical protein